MHYSTFYIFNHTFFILSFCACIVSFLLLIYWRRQPNFLVRLSLMVASVLSLCASFMPTLAIIVAVASTPAFIYHMFDPLAIAPFVVGAAGFIVTGSFLIVLQELSGFISPRFVPPHFSMSLIAMLVFIVMAFQLNTGLVDYQTILNSQKIIRYASIGTDQKQLERTYTQVALSHDKKLFYEVLSALALNHHAPLELLRVVYTRTMNSIEDTVQRSYILSNLAKNPHTSADILKKLILSVSHVDTAKADTALMTVSRNPNFSPETISQLTTYPDCEIRRAIISYPNISENVLKQMIARDPDVGIRHDARRRLDFLHGISHLDMDKKAATEITDTAAVLADKARNITNPNQLFLIYQASEVHANALTVLENLASNCYTATHVLQQIYEKSLTLKGYPRTVIMMALSINPNTPVDTLQKLSMEKDLMILRGLATNPSLPNNIIGKFALFPDCKIRKEIVCMQKTSPAMLERLRADRDESVALEAVERYRQEGAYLTICQEMKKKNPSCQKYYGTTTAPDLRLYPNTSQMKETSAIHA